MKTIAFFSAYSTPHSGGIESYTKSLERELTRRGYKVINVSTNFTGGKEHWVEDGIVQYRLPVFGLWKKRYPFIKKNQHYCRLMAEIAAAKPDVIIANTRFHLTSLAAADLAKKLQVSVYIIEHGAAPLTLHNPLADFCLRIAESYLTWRIKKLATAFYGVSQSANEHLLRRFKIVARGVWYNHIDILPATTKTPHQVATVTYVGRLIKQKGVETLLEACRLFDSKTILVNIVGDGEELAKLKKNFPQKNIIFHHCLEPEKVMEILKATDIFVYAPHHPEGGLPSSILEAGMNKCAVITSRQGGIEELIKESKNGVYVDSTIDDMKQKISLLKNNATLRQRLGEQLYDDIKNNFSTQKVAATIVQNL